MTHDTGAALDADPDPAGGGPDDEVRLVPGTVRLMTDDPLEIPRATDEVGLRQRMARQLGRHPWLLPVALLTAIAVILVGRRH